MSSTRVAISIVNYKSASWTVGALTALAEEMAAAKNTRVYVVDNDSQDGSADVIEAAVKDNGWDWARVVRAPKNGGFSYGNNLAVRTALSEGRTLDYVILLNPDTRPEPGAIGELVAFMQQHPLVGIAGSRILNEDGSVRRSAFRFQSIAGELERAAHFGPLSRLLAHKSISFPPPEREEPVDWVSGAAMIIRQQVLEDVGMMDEDYFLYFEETDFCLQVARAGWQCWYVPSSRVTHFVGQSTGATGPAALKKPVPGYWFESRHRFFNKNYGKAYAVAADVAWLAGTALARVKGALQRKTPEDPPRVVQDFTRAAVANLKAPVPHIAPTPVAPDDKAIPLPSGDKNENPAGISFGGLLWEDFCTHERNVLEPGFWAVAVHRFGNWRMDVPSRLARVPLSMAYDVLNTAVRWGWGIKLDYTVKVGRRVRIWHHGGMVLGARSIGNDVHIRQNTTFGISSRKHPWAKPIIEDGVDIGAGACIVGHTRVGHHSIIGANTVVSKDVPPLSLVVGVPGKVVKNLAKDAASSAPEAASRAS